MDYQKMVRLWCQINDDIKVLRGGSLYDAPWSCRSADRLWGVREHRDTALGFRIVGDFK